MSLRVHVIAEGSGELLGEGNFPQETNTLIQEDDLGAAHVLTRRLVVAHSPIPSEAVAFFVPPLSGGKAARGSMLLDSDVLDEVLTILPGVEKPRLVVLLVDADGQARQREQALSMALARRSRVALGIPVEEFEAWLAADGAAVTNVVGRSLQPFDAGSPGAAKSALAQATAGRSAREARLARRSIAATLDFDVVRRHSESFIAFEKRLQQVLSGL